jgi:hypothetical protein
MTRAIGLVMGDQFVANGGGNELGPGSPISGR